MVVVVVVDVLLLGGELVLPYVVERKTWDDLSDSIKDGRFQRQKAAMTAASIK